MKKVQLYCTKRTCVAITKLKSTTENYPKSGRRFSIKLMINKGEGFKTVITRQNAKDCI